MSFSSDFRSDSITRQELISQTEECFEQANYKISKIENSSCIDIIAENKVPVSDGNYSATDQTNLRIFLKVLGNLNTFKDKQSKDMKLLSHIGGGVPLLIASRYSRQRRLEHGIVYTRYTISSINIKTLETLLKNNVNPSELAIRGKSEPLVSIKGSELEKILKSLINYTQQEICNQLKISRQSLLAYQKETIKPTITKYKEIVTFLDDNIKENDIKEIDLRLRKPLTLFFSDQNDTEFIYKSFNELNLINNSDIKFKVNKHLEKLKFNKFWFQSLPWDGLITYQDNKNQIPRYANKDPRIKKIFTGVVDSETDPDLQNKRLEKSSKVFDFLNEKAIWLIDSEDIPFIDEDKISTKNIFIMPTEEFFEIKESRKLKKQINDTLQDRTNNE